MSYPYHKDALLYMLVRDMEIAKLPNSLWQNNAKRELRARLASIRDPLALPLNQGERVVVTDDLGGSFTEYRLFDHKLDAYELERYRDEHFIELHYAFDCTGKLFSVSMTFRNTPCGTVMIHRLTIDC